MVEIGWRLFDIDYNPNPNWRYHPVLGWSQTPGMAYVVEIDGESVQVEFNSLGFRDVERSLAKPPGVKRIAVVGDSFSEAIQVNIEDTYFRILEQELNRDREVRWEVLNFGVGDFGNAQALLALEHFGLTFDPDLVIFQIFPLNDVCNNTLELAGLCKSENDLYRPYLVAGPDGLEPAWATPLRHALRSTFVTFGILERNWYLREKRESGRSLDELHQDRYRERGIPADPLLYTFVPEPRQIEAFRAGWSVTEAILQETGRLLQSRGIPWLGVVIPFEAQVSLDWEGFAGAHPELGMERDYPERRLERIFAEMGVPCVAMLEPFQSRPDVFFPTRGGHLNPAAHRFLAEVLLSRLEELR